VIFEYIEVFLRILHHAKFGIQTPADFASQQQFPA